MLNPKGGSGKTTIATNLAAHYATQGRPVVLIDEDPQGSTMRWLGKRPDSAPTIYGIASGESQPGVTRAFAMRMPPETQRIVVDTSAALQDHQLIDAVRGAHRIILPVMPSDIDIHAATRCIASLLLKAKVDRTANRLAIVANRVKTNTLVFKALMRFLGALDIPVAAILRDTQCYVHAAEQGLGAHEIETAQRKDVLQWMPLIDWIERGVVQPPELLHGQAPQGASNVTPFEPIRPRRSAGGLH